MIIRFLFNVFLPIDRKLVLPLHSFKDGTHVEREPKPECTKDRDGNRDDVRGGLASRHFRSPLNHPLFDRVSSLLVAEGEGYRGLTDGHHPDARNGVAHGERFIIDDHHRLGLPVEDALDADGIQRVGRG